MVAEDVALFLLLCIITSLAGFGVLAILRLQISRTLAWLVAPGMCLVCWVVVMQVGVSLGLPVRRLALPLWVMTTVAAAYGTWKARDGITLDAVKLLAMAVVLPIGIMPFDFLQGLGNFIGGTAGDGWSYVAFGQYLWEMRKGAGGHFAPLYQYATHLSRSRFIGGGLLGFISLLTGHSGDTQMASGYFVAWSLFMFGASCASVGIANRLQGRWLYLFCTLAVGSRWVVGAVQIHNYDNLIAISFLPLTMGIVGGLARTDWRSILALGAAMAAAVGTYPEMSPLVVLGAAVSLVRRARADSNRSAWTRLALGVPIVATILLIPSSSDLSSFMTNQLISATAASGSRAGEGGFSELMRLHTWSVAIWGLLLNGAEMAGPARHFIRHSLGLALWLLLGFGVARVVKFRQWDIGVVAAFSIGGALFMITLAEYSYGAYKFILLGWWAIVWLVVAGSQEVIQRWQAYFKPSSRPMLRIAPKATIAVVMAGVLVFVTLRIVREHRSLTAVSIAPYRQVLEIQRIVGSEPVFVAVDDDLSSRWAVYFLRTQPIWLLWYRGYMAFPHVTPLLDQAAPIDARTIHYVLSDETSGSHEAVWSGGPYTLWRVPQTGTALLGNVVNPNGIERLNGRPFFWIGGGDTHVDVVATTAGEVELSGRFVLGPSLPGIGIRRVLVDWGAGNEIVTITQEGSHSITFPVDAGRNHVYMRSLDEPAVNAMNGRDTRPLLLGVEGLEAREFKEHRAP